MALPDFDPQRTRS